MTVRICETVTNGSLRMRTWAKLNQRVHTLTPLCPTPMRPRPRSDRNKARPSNYCSDSGPLRVSQEVAAIANPGMEKSKARRPDAPGSKTKKMKKVAPIGPAVVRDSF